ncbi:MAG: hypothetical protein WAT22_17315 [Saprospiraceae bacterium]|nr:hypothetical protein [Saprospiraceae bacterium]
MTPSGKFNFSQLRLSKSYLTLAEPSLRSLTGCGLFTPVMRPIDKSPKVRDFAQQIY